MTTIDLQALGITPESLEDRIVEAAVTQLFSTLQFDAEEGDFTAESTLSKKLRKRIAKEIDKAVDAIGDKYIAPNVSQYIETFTLQQTNRWGEKQGAPVSFIEYMVQRADAYMREPVNHQGKTQAEDSYSWSQKSTRIVHMIEKHLAYSIDTAMQQALKDANSSIAKGLEEAVKVSLAEVQKKLKVEVKP